LKDEEFEKLVCYMNQGIDILKIIAEQVDDSERQVPVDELRIWLEHRGDYDNAEDCAADLLQEFDIRRKAKS
jgi:hypothetical protein